MGKKIRRKLLSGEQAPQPGLLNGLAYIGKEPGKTNYLANRHKTPVSLIG
jgi:hypothetical protein